MPFEYDFARPALTTDVVVLRGTSDSREVLLVLRAREPYAGRWALPGGFVDEGERLEDAARRELLEETSVAPAGPLTPVGAYGDPGRDPRGWTVSVVFLARVEGDVSARGGDDAAEAAWFAEDSLPPLAFDHDGIVRDGLELARHTESSTQRGPARRGGAAGSGRSGTEEDT
jgi:8-oxo-dGTP diphosphatase